MDLAVDHTGARIGARTGVHTAAHTGAVAALGLARSAGSHCGTWGVASFGHLCKKEMGIHFTDSALFLPLQMFNVLCHLSCQYMYVYKPNIGTSGDHF